jgi:hypothetical protein
MRMRIVLLVASFVYTIVGTTVLFATELRTEINLNGRWEHKIVESLDALPKEGGWKPFIVPGMLRGHNYRRAWFRRTFAVPQTLRGKRIKIHFGGVKFNSKVYVNGKQAGGCFGGYRHFEVDVTDVVLFDQENELLVGCHDWTGVFTSGKVEFGKDVGWNRLRQIPKDKIISPVGGQVNYYGIWDDVILIAHPAVYVKDIFIKPSIRNRELVVDYTLANESDSDADVQLHASVRDKNTNLLTLPTCRMNIAAGKTDQTTLQQVWPKPHLWSHKDPYLYQLQSTLSTGDILTTRFGFREFWIEDHEFFLNGKKIHLLATSGWPQRIPTSREEISRYWLGFKEAGCVAFRTHTQPWRKVYYDVADEVGLLMIIEGAVFNDDTTYRIFDPVFWDNYASHLRAMADRHKNHPSVIMWSLENEFHGGRLNDESSAKKDLIRMGKLLKQWDPTRPITYESDGDPGGVADVIGIHYPHEYPQFTCWPNEAYWLAEPQDSDRQFLNGREKFFWDKNKPLYVGEFLWIPSSDPSWNTVFLGDEAYIDYRMYRNIAKGESWKMQILGYRHFDVSGMCPWTLTESGPFDRDNALYQAVKYAYQPIAAFCHDYDSRFYSGETVARRVEIFNDAFESSDLLFTWKLIKGNHSVDQGQEKLRLESGGQRMINVKLHMSGVRQRTPLEWTLTLQRQGQIVFKDTHPCSVFPPLHLTATAKKIGLYDPVGQTRKVLLDKGFHTIDVDSMDEIDGKLDILLIGAQVLQDSKISEPVIGRVHPWRKALTEYLQQGGRVFVLEQSAYPLGLFTVNLTKQQSTMTFPVAFNHPALRGVQKDDLKFWRGNHIVAAQECLRPTHGNMIPIVVSGSELGIDHAPLLEIPMGNGCVIHSQLKLIEKLTTEPVAAQIFNNLIRYLAEYSPKSRKTGLVGGSPKYRSCLRSLGLQFDDLTEKLSEANLSDYSLILCRSETGHHDRLRQYISNGGTLLVHRLQRKHAESFFAELELDLALQAYSGTLNRAEESHPLLASVRREDIYWLGDYVHLRTPRAEQMSDGIISQTIGSKPRESYEVEDWDLAGHIVRRQKQGVAFATVGSASAQVSFPRTGNYIIGILARGQPAAGIFPVAQVSIDDKPLGLISTQSEQWHTVATSGFIPKGKHKLTVSYINDGGTSTNEDRNLYVDKVLVAYDTGQSGIAFLTHPPALAVVPYGKGKIVLDQIRWDNEERNTRKAARYACSLLTALGGDFDSQLGVAVECENMESQPNRPQTRFHSSFVSMASEGYLHTRIQVAETGDYKMELVASGTQAENIYPQVEVHLDGQRVGAIQLVHSGWQPYAMNIELKEGNHELRLTFVNDLYIPGIADRNVQLDKVIFYRN